MSATALRKSQTNSNRVPLTQNTAPVIEFRCLYTHDVRRKSKRWQDGFLKFHTFNNRVMVYDVPRNFIGDTHWKDQAELQEGDEISLECAVLVQVNEPIERSVTDLTPLFEKRDKSSAKRLVGVRDRSRQPELSHNTRTAAQSQNRHKPLQALLGDSKGPHGKAVLHFRSPYEIRSSDAENDWPDRPSSKRRKVDTSATTKSLVQATDTAREMIEMPGLWRTKEGQSHASSNVQCQPGQSAASIERSGLDLRRVIEISSDREHPSSDGFEPGPTMPPPPPSRVKTQQQGLRRPAPSRQKNNSTVSKTLKNRDFEVNAPARPSSPPVRMTNKISPAQQDPVPPEPIFQNEEDPQSERPAGKPLKFSKKASRNMLVCQDISRKRPTSKAAEKILIDEENNSPLVRKQSIRRKDHSAQVTATKKTDRERLQERVAQIGKRNCHQSTDSSSPAIVPPVAKNLATPPAAKTTTSSSFPFLSTDDDNVIALAQLDQQILDPAPSAAGSPSSAPDPALDRNRDHHYVRSAQSRNDDGTDPRPGYKKPTISTENLEQARQRAELEGTVLRRPFQKAKTFAGSGAERAGEKAGGKREGGEQSATSKDNDSGPWSREAEDLFDWRPPGWNERGKRGEVLVNG
ncbi:MAG: hypothetical protein Q9165_000450 [Trypethelium subeluteriae]